MAASLSLHLSRRLQPPCAALLILATVQLCATARPVLTARTAVRGVIASAPQIAPERS